MRKGVPDYFPSIDDGAISTIQILNKRRSKNGNNLGMMPAGGGVGQTNIIIRGTANVQTPSGEGNLIEFKISKIDDNFIHSIKTLILIQVI